MLCNRCHDVIKGCLAVMTHTHPIAHSLGLLCVLTAHHYCTMVIVCYSSNELKLQEAQGATVTHTCDES